MPSFDTDDGGRFFAVALYSFRPSREQVGKPNSKTVNAEQIFLEIQDVLEKAHLKRNIGSEKKSQLFASK